MKRISDIRLQQTQGLDFTSVAAEFEVQLHKQPLTLLEEIELLGEVAEDNFDGPIHARLYDMQDTATKTVAEREGWLAPWAIVETGLCLEVLKDVE